MGTIQAIYQDGVFKPKEPVSLPEACEVQLQIVFPLAENPRLEQELTRLRQRSPEQVAEARERILKASRPARPLPDGKSLSDMVEGKWPGDETDEEIRLALEELS